MARTIFIANSRIYESKTIYNFFSPDVTVTVSSSADLLFPVATGKAYYQVGDIIFVRDLETRQAARQYKEFEAEKDFTWGRFLLHVLEADKATIGGRIVAIYGDGEGARIVMRPILKLSDTEWVQLTTLRGEHVTQHHIADLRNSYVFAYVYHTTKIWIPVFKGMTEILMLPIGGGAKNLAKPLFKRLGKKGFRALISWGGKKFAKAAAGKAVQFVGKVAFGTAQGAAKKFAIKHHAQLRKDRLKGTSDAKVNFNDIIQEALRDSFAESVTKELVKLIEDQVPGKAAEGAIPPEIKERINRYFAQKLLKLTMEPFSRSLKAAIKALPVVEQETYMVNLTDRLKKEFKQLLSAKTLSDVLEEGLKEIAKQPELIVSLK